VPTTFRTLFYPPQGHIYRDRPVDLAMLAYGQDGATPMGWAGVQARLAALSYVGTPIGNWAGAGTQGYLAVNQHHAVIAFRGTEPGDFRDLLINLKLFLAPEAGEAKVHSGFQTALNQVWPLVEALLRLLPPDLPLLFCGHSLGGALAMLAASRLSARTPKVYTYGGPRVGNPAWGQRLLSATNKQVFRNVNEEDIIASVPARRLGYAHAPANVIRLREGSVSEDTVDLGANSLELAAAIGELALWAGHGNLDVTVNQPRLADHSPSHYLNRAPA
jgi:hypothetical protein